jgi:glycosyltransferase involved in cell wall biosynthesis
VNGVDFPLLVVLFEDDPKRLASNLARLTPTLGVRDRVMIIRHREGGQVTWLPRPTSRAPQILDGPTFDCLRAALSDEQFEGVVVSYDTIVFQGRWIEGIRSQLATRGEGVVVAPRSTCIDGPQRAFVTEGMNLSVKDAFRRFNVEWERSRRELWTFEPYVSSRIFAARPIEFLAALDLVEAAATPVDRLVSLYLALAPGKDIVIAHSSMIHAEEVIRPSVEASVATYSGSPAQPFVSACLIVKDEEEFLPTCLDAVSKFVDEIVIVDTGSTDRTIEVAQSYGARVFEDPWRNDFSYSRNVALSQCRGKWIVWVDADEVFEGNPDSFRHMLLSVGDKVEGFSVQISNEVGSGLNPLVYHAATRVFRRADLQWSGALHEQLWSRTMDRTTESIATDVVTIAHKGYLESVMRAKGKAERNLAVVKEGSTGGAGWEESDINLARSLMMNHEQERALELAINVLINGSVPTFRYLSLHVITDCLANEERAGELATYYEHFDELGVSPNAQRSFRARMFAALGEVQRALDELDLITVAQTDYLGMVVSPMSVATDRAKCLAKLGRASEAADVALSAMATRNMAFHLEFVLDLLKSAERPMAEIVDALPDGKENMIFAQLLQIDIDRADEVLEELYRAGRYVREVLATASLVARKLTLDRALAWSRRLRDSGQPLACPLRFIAHDAEGGRMDEASEILAQEFGEMTYGHDSDLVLSHLGEKSEVR